MNAVAVAECRETIRQHSKSFALASAMLPRAKRDEVAVVYTWCRRADDAIDLAERHEQPAALARLRAELDMVYSDRPIDDHALAAFQQVVRRYAIPRHYPSELLAGMEMDVRQTVYADLRDLLHYCYRVAGTVGLMMSHVLGVTTPLALRQAAHLGMAMQMTNIARDVREDWTRGRLYLPKSMLRAHDAFLPHPTIEGKLSVADAGRLRPVVRELLDLAERMYRSADSAMITLPWRASIAVRTARLVYAAIGARLAQRDHDVLSGRVFVPRSSKLWLALRAGAAASTELPSRLVTPARRAPLPGVVRFPDDVLAMHPSELVEANHARLPSVNPATAFSPRATRPEHDKCLNTMSR